MLELLGVLFSGALSGGATGLLGVLLQRFFDLKKAKTDIELARLQLESTERVHRLDLESQERMASKAAEVQALQAQLAAQTAEVQAAEATVQASYKNDGAMYSAPAAQEHSRIVRWMMGAVDAVRGLMRPGITAYTLWMLTAVFLWVQSMYNRMGLIMSPEQVHALTKDAVGTITYLAVTTTVWWFGVRPSQPPGRR